MRRLIQAAPRRQLDTCNDQLPTEIAALETLIKEIQNSIADPEFYVQEQQAVQSKLQELADNEALLESRVERWSKLEALQTDLRS